MRHYLSHFNLIVMVAFFVIVLGLFLGGVAEATDNDADGLKEATTIEGSAAKAEEVEGFLVRDLNVASTAKDFTLKTLAGEEVTLSTLRGRVVLLSFWATWCVPCKTEFPALVRLSGEFHERGLTVVAIAADTKGRVEDFIANDGYASGEVVILLDRYGSVMRDYGVRLFPMGVIIGADGRLIGTMTGARDYSGEAAFAYFSDLLAEESKEERLR